jgi:hypothetical protein
VSRACPSGSSEDMDVAAPMRRTWSACCACATRVQSTAVPASGLVEHADNEINFLLSTRFMASIVLFENHIFYSLGLGVLISSTECRMVSYMPTRSCPAINIDFEKTVCLLDSRHSARPNLRYPNSGQIAPPIFPSLSFRQRQSWRSTFATLRPFQALISSAKGASAATASTGPIALSIASGVAGTSSATGLPGLSECMASAIAANTEIASINGGSPTAFER